MTRVSGKINTFPIYGESVAEFIQKRDQYISASERNLKIGDLAGKC